MSRSPRPNAFFGVLTAATLAFTVLALIATATPAAATVFSNPASISVPDATCNGPPGTATPYPSDIVVSGATGTVSDVNVTLTGATHPFEGDFEVLLVGPGGGSQNLKVLSDAGTGSLSNATVAFDDSAAAQAPQNSAWGPGTYKPTNYTEIINGGVDTFPAPAPAPSANTTLAAAFNGINPNGTWKLYVTDDGCGDAGSIGGGWSLDLTTTAGASTSTAVTSSLNPSRTGQSVTFTSTVTSSGSPVTTGTVTFTEGASTLASNVPVNASGQATFATSSLTEGNHNVTATYNGTASFATSNGTVDQRVDNNTTVSGSTYCNTGAITVPASGAINGIGNANPYPSNIFVTGASSPLSKVTVTLKNASHSFDGDVEALLVGPGGQNLVTLSDAGTAAVSNVTLNLDDAGASLLPQTGSWGAANSTITAKPTNYTELASDSFPAPAPSPSAATTLGTFNGTDPNGTWKLYVLDDGAPDTGSIAGGWCLNFTVTPKPPVKISELRSSGPGGTGDEFVELYNDGSSPVTVATNDGSPGWALVRPDGTVVGTIANGTSIPAHGHYLLTGSTYSLAAYAAGNGSLSADLASVGGGLALFNTQTAGNFVTGNRLDAVGFTGAASGFFEGTPISQPAGFSADQFAFVRRMIAGAPVDTDNNSADFVEVDAGSGAGQAGFGTPLLGAPGPQNLASPVIHNDILQSSLLDSGVDASASPNLVFTSGSPGTLVLNRRLTNCSGQTATGVCLNSPATSPVTVTRLRFRISDLTTIGTPGSGKAILLAQTSPGSTAVPISAGGGGGTANVSGIPLDPPSAAGQGGVGSSWTATAVLPGGGLIPGASINVQFKFQVNQTGSYRFAYDAEDDLEAFTGSSSTPSSAPVPAGAAIAPATTGTVTPVTATAVTHKPAKRARARKRCSHTKARAKRTGIPRCSSKHAPTRKPAKRRHR